MPVPRCDYPSCPFLRDDSGKHQAIISVAFVMTCSEFGLNGRASILQHDIF